MKSAIEILVVLLTMSQIGLGRAGVITNTFDSVPSGLQCGEQWTNQGIVLNFAPTIASEDGSGGYCAFEIDPGYVSLYPSRLRLDFSLLQQPVSRIEADIQDYCGPDCTVLFAYMGTTNIGRVGNSNSATLSLDFSGPHPDNCAIRSFEANVTEIRIFTEQAPPPALRIEEANGLIAVMWPTNSVSYLLQKTSNLTVTSGWMAESNNIQREGTNFVYYPSTPLGAEFFRLRLN